MGTTNGGGAGKRGEGNAPQYIGTTGGPQTWIWGQHGELVMARLFDEMQSVAVITTARPNPSTTSRRNIFRLLILKTIDS
jgi:hypothetical protein